MIIRRSVSGRNAKRSVGGLSSALMIAVAVMAVSATMAHAASLDTIVPTALLDDQCRNDTLAGGPPYYICLNDNAHVSYYLDSVKPSRLENEDRQAATDGIFYFRPTVLAFENVPHPPDTSGANETDIIYQERNPPSGADGATWCNDAVDSAYLKCDQHYIAIAGPGEYDAGLSCHETGHAVGLVHGGNVGGSGSDGISDLDTRLGCMVLDHEPDTPLGLLNRTNINEVY